MGLGLRAFDPAFLCLQFCCHSVTLSGLSVVSLVQQAGLEIHFHDKKQHYLKVLGSGGMHANRSP